MWPAPRPRQDYGFVPCCEAQIIIARIHQYVLNIVYFAMTVLSIPSYFGPHPKGGGIWQ